MVCLCDGRFLSSCPHWASEIKASTGRPRSVAKGMERGPRAPLSTAARVFEKLAWIFYNRMQLEGGVNLVKYLCALTQLPAAYHAVWVPGESAPAPWSGRVSG